MEKDNKCYANESNGNKCYCKYEKKRRSVLAMHSHIKNFWRKHACCVFANLHKTTVVVANLMRDLWCFCYAMISYGSSFNCQILGFALWLGPTGRQNFWCAFSLHTPSRTDLPSFSGHALFSLKSNKGQTLGESPMRSNEVWHEHVLDLFWERKTSKSVVTWIWEQHDAGQNYIATCPNLSQFRTKLTKHNQLFLRQILWSWVTVDEDRTV